MRTTSSLLLLGLLMYSGIFVSPAAARDPVTEVKQIFTERSAIVQEADGPEGGLLLRMINLDLNEGNHRAFRAELSAAQRVIDIRELHLTHSGEQELGAGGLGFIAELPKLRLLSLGGCNYNRADLKLLTHCPELERLYISGPMDKAGWEGIAAAKKLELIRAQYLRAEWESFPSLPNLKLLDAESSDLDDKGAAALANCPELTVVYAYRTKVTNAGLLELAKAKKLKFLGVSSETIDDAGATAFKKARPDVELLTEKPVPQAPRPRPGAEGPLALLERP